MYKLMKDKSALSGLRIVNPDTKASIDLGMVTMSILGVLEEAGISNEKGNLPALRDEWDIEIDEDTEEKLAKSAMPMKKPVRIKKDNVVAPEAPSEQPAQEKKQPVDVFNLIFGTE